MKKSATTVKQEHPSKIDRLLSIFTAEEAVQFDLWLQSPWANSNKKLVVLYGLLKKPWTKEQLFQKLYPGRAYDDKMMRNLLSALTKQAEKFLAHQRLRADEELAGQLIAKVYLERHETLWHQKLVGELIGKLEAKPLKETEDYLQLALLYELLHFQVENPKLVKKPETLQAAEQHLDCYYSIQKWRLLTQLNERQLMLSENTEVESKMELLEFITKDLELPVASLYKGHLALTKALTVEGFMELKGKTLASFDSISKTDKQFMLSYLINSAARLWLNGHVPILANVLELYQIGLNERLLVHHDRFSEQRFTNIVTTANSLRQFGFVADFIEKHTKHLAPESREDAKIWATAHTLSKQKDFEQCIMRLSHHKFSSEHFMFQSKWLLVEAYFEAYKKDHSYYSFMADFTEAFKKYVQRANSLSQARKAAYLNFINYTFLLVKNMEEKKLTVARLAAIKNRVNQEQQIQGKQWILEKIAELE